MKPNSLFAAAALALAASGVPAAQATGAEVLNEGFANVGGLNGWAQVNNSMPAGSGWFQGNAGLFPAQAGDTLNCVGLDTVRVMTAVPEPTAVAMLGIGLGLLGLLRRTSRA